MKWKQSLWSIITSGGSKPNISYNGNDMDQSTIPENPLTTFTTQRIFCINSRVRASTSSPPFSSLGYHPHWDSLATRPILLCGLDRRLLFKFCYYLNTEFFAVCLTWYVQRYIYDSMAWGVISLLYRIISLLFAAPLVSFFLFCCRLGNKSFFC